MNVLRKKFGYPDLKRAVVEQSRLFGPSVILIEDKASGTQLIQELREAGVSTVTCYKPEGDKIMRLNAQTGAMEGGFVHLPREAHWLADYLHELSPQAGLLPADRAQRAHCRAICGEMHSGFSNLRSALPMNIKAHFPGFKAWAGARGDIERITAIWRECLDKYGGPYLFGSKPCAADAMYAPVCARFLTYDVALEPHAAKYCRTVMALPLMQEWIAGAKAEPDELEELDVEF